MRWKGQECQRLLSIRFSGWVNEKWLVDLLSLWQKAHNLTLQEWVTRHVMSSWPLDNLDLFGVICCIIAYCLAFILLNEVNRKRHLIIHRCLYSYIIVCINDLFCKISAIYFCLHRKLVFFTCSSNNAVSVGV